MWTLETLIQISFQMKSQILNKIKYNKNDINILYSVTSQSDCWYFIFAGQIPSLNGHWPLRLTIVSSAVIVDRTNKNSIHNETSQS